MRTTSSFAAAYYQPLFEGKENCDTSNNCLRPHPQTSFRVPKLELTSRTRSLSQQSNTSINDLDNSIMSVAS